VNRPDLPSYLDQCDRALGALAPFIEETGELFFLARVEALIAEAAFLLVKNGVPRTHLSETLDQIYSLAHVAVMAGARSYNDMREQSTSGSDDGESVQ
jgi:hypothetical protein